MKEKKLKPKILQNTISKSGITLIALVITIIILLILAGVALATLTGQGNIIKNAEDAVGKYNNSVNGEQWLLNEIEIFLLKKTDMNPPIVRPKQDNLTIIAGEKYDVDKLFFIDENGDSGIKNVIYSTEDISVLPIGQYILTCTVNKNNGKSATASITISVKAKYTEQSFTTAGKYVWTCPEGITRIRIALCGGGRRSCYWK